MVLTGVKGLRPTDPCQSRMGCTTSMSVPLELDRLLPSYGHVSNPLT